MEISSKEVRRAGEETGQTIFPSELLDSWSPKRNLLLFLISDFLHS